MYESRKHKPIPSSAFAWRLIKHLAAALGMLGASLVAGMFGYMELEKMSVVDAFLNAAMLLGGMGPVNAPITMPGKLFAGAFQTWRYAHENTGMLSISLVFLEMAWIGALALAEKRRSEQIQALRHAQR